MQLCGLIGCYELPFVRCAKMPNELVVAGTGLVICSFVLPKYKHFKAMVMLFVVCDNVNRLWCVG